MPYKKISGVYTITNITTNKILVGESVNILSRLRHHKSRLRKNKHDNSYLQKAWNKYGESDFLFEILEECNIEFTKSQEHYWSNLLNTKNRNFGYNIMTTNPYTAGTNINRIVTKETILKRSSKLRGRVQSKEEKERRINSLKEYYKNNTHHCLGKPRSESTKNKLSKIHKERVNFIKMQKE